MTEHSDIPLICFQIDMTGVLQNNALLPEEFCLLKPAGDQPARVIHNAMARISTVIVGAAEHRTHQSRIPFPSDQPGNLTVGSHKKVWWRCTNGHEWQAAPKTRVRMGAGCPICANDVAQAGYNDLTTLFPAVAAEWHPTKNGNLTPSQVVSGSHQTLWWRRSLGHEWRAEIVDRTRGSNGCPYCGNKKVLAGFNDLASIEPEIAAEWHPTLNGALTPEMVTAGSNRKVWWICPDGHVWRTAISNRTNAKKRTGCPVCAGNVSQKHRHLYLPPQPDAERRRA